MKKNNLLKTVLLFVFAIFISQGCREEATAIENQNIKAKISYKKFNELQYLKNTLEKVETEFIRTHNTTALSDYKTEVVAPNSLSIDQEADVIEMSLEDGGTMYSFVLESNTYNVQSGYVVENLNVIVNSDNSESYFIAKYVPTDGMPFYNISDFQGTVTYTDLSGSILGSTTFSGGYQTEYYLPVVNIGCWGYVLWVKSNGEIVIHSAAYICDEDGGNTGSSGTDSGGTSGDSGSSGTTSGTDSGASNSNGGYSGGSTSSSAVPNIPTQDAVEQKLYKSFLTNITQEQYQFLAQNQTINDQFFFYLSNNEFSTSSKDFTKWGINFFMQNSTNGISNISWTQFKNWFMNADGTTNISFNSTATQNNSMIFNSKTDFGNFLNNNLNQSTYSNSIISDTGSEKMIRSRINRMGIYSTGIDVNVKLLKSNNLWNFGNVTSEEFIGVGFIYSWSQKDFTSNTASNVITVEVFGYEKINIFIEGIGTIYKNYGKVVVKINQQTGNIISSIFIDLPG